MNDEPDLAKPPETLEVIKRGETSLTVTLIRSASGLTVSVKAHPQVEAFMRGLGEGQTTDAKAAGPYWRPVGSSPKPLMIYSQNVAVEPVFLNSGDVVNINHCGQPLLIPYNDGNPGKRTMVNLSFLRLVGVSEDAGVTFSVRGVHSFEAVNKMREQIGEGYKRFYQTYMKPIMADIVVSTQGPMAI